MLIHGLEQIRPGEPAVYFSYSDQHLPITLTDDEFIAAMKQIDAEVVEFAAMAGKLLGVPTVKLGLGRVLHLNG